MNPRPERRRCIRESNSLRAMSTGEPSTKKQCDTTQQPLNLADLSALSVRGLGFYRETVAVDPGTHNENETNNMRMNQGQSYTANSTANNDLPSSAEENANLHIRFASNEEVLVEEPSTSKGAQRIRSKKHKPNVSQQTQTPQARAKLTHKQKEELVNNSDVVLGVLNLETGCLLIDVDQFPTCVCLTVKNEHVQSTTLHYRPIQPCEDCCHVGVNPQTCSSDMKFPLQAHRPVTILAREILMQLHDILRQGNVGSVSGSILLQLPSPVLTPSCSGDSNPVSVSSSTTVTLSVTATVTTSSTTATVSLVNSKTFSESITTTNAGSCSNDDANSQLDGSVKISDSEETNSSQHFVPATHMVPPASQLGGQTPHVFPQPHMIHPPHMGVSPHPYIAPPAHMGYQTHLVHPPHMGPPGPFVNQNHMVQQGHLIPRPQVVTTSRATDLIPTPHVVPPTNMVSTSHSVTSSYMGAPSHPAQAVLPPHSVPSYMVPTSQVVSSPYMVPISRELSGTYVVPTSHAVPISQSTPKSSIEPPKSRPQSPVRKPVPARIMKRRRTIYPGEIEETIEHNTPEPSTRNDELFNMSGGSVSLVEDSRNFGTPNSTMVAAIPAPQVPRVSPSTSTGRPRPISFRRSTVTGAVENTSTDDTILRSQHRLELLQFIRNQANFEQNQMRMNAFHEMYNQDRFQNAQFQDFPGRGGRYSSGAIE